MALRLARASTALRASAATAAPLRAAARRALSDSAPPPLLSVSPAKFNGLTLSVAAASPPPTADAFGEALARAVREARAEGRTSLWLNLSLAQGELFPPAARCGFAFHHAEGALATLHAWLPPAPCPVPPFATHQVGVAGVALDAAGRLLVVKDVGKASGWKFPGGLAELGEDFGATAVRETREETGVACEFRSVLALRQQHGVAWGRSDLYVMCRLALPPGGSGEITLDPREIADARWMDAGEFIASTSHPLNRFVAQAAVHEARREAAGAAGGGSSSAAIAEESVFIGATGRTVKCYRAGAAWPIGGGADG